MARIMAIDLGRKRCGIAVTDSLQLVGNALTTVPTNALEAFLKNYMVKEQVERIIVGKPVDMHGNPSECTRYINPVLNRIRHLYPTLPIEQVDERFTSVLAHKAMISGNMPQSRRRDKAEVDRISASIILNDYLEQRNNNNK